MTHVSNMSPEKLPIYLHGWICVYIDRNVGGPSYDPCEHFDQWWNCWSHLGIPNCLHRLLFRLLIDCRDGFHVSRIIWRDDHFHRTDNRRQGTYIRRTIPLGLRMVTTTVPALFVVHCWLALFHWLASCDLLHHFPLRNDHPRIDCT